jgi:hypothetical protein
MLIDSGKTRPGTPSGLGDTSREAILFGDVHFFLPFDHTSRGWSRLPCLVVVVLSGEQRPDDVGKQRRANISGQWGGGVQGRKFFVAIL